jgi:hypothetical protein
MRDILPARGSPANLMQFSILNRWTERCLMLYGFAIQGQVEGLMSLVCSRIASETAYGDLSLSRFDLWLMPFIAKLLACLVKLIRGSFK